MAAALCRRRSSLAVPDHVKRRPASPARDSTHLHRLRKRNESQDSHQLQQAQTIMYQQHSHRRRRWRPVLLGRAVSHIQQFNSAHNTQSLCIISIVSTTLIHEMDKNTLLEHAAASEGGALFEHAVSRDELRRRDVEVAAVSLPAEARDVDRRVDLIEMPGRKSSAKRRDRSGERRCSHRHGSSQCFHGASRDTARASAA